METNGFSLNNNPEEKRNERKSLIIGVLAGISIAALVGGAFTLGGRSSGTDAAASTSAGQAIGDQAVDDNEDAASGGGSGEQGGESDGGGIDEPTVAPEEPDAEPTATATATPDGACPLCPEDLDDLAPLPTATPSDPCPFCPDLVDDLQIEPTPVIFCPLCLDPQLDLDLPELSFVETSVKLCAGFVAMKAEISGNAEIWVEYEKDGDAMESPHTFGGSMLEGETATWGWFGSWGWIYPYDFVFHAEDAEGNHIEKYVLADHVC